MSFKLKSVFKPTGDQPQAIEKLTKGVLAGDKQTLLGVTGSGKTFTIANVIAKTGKNTLIISHNKTLANQLYQEISDFFPQNNVEYFVSYYDYYQPESYLPSTDTYIAKTATVNKKIEQLRLRATASLASGEPTIIVSTVSCIYGLGNPDDYFSQAVKLSKGDCITRTQIAGKLVDVLYDRNDAAPGPGTFRVKGDTVDVFPAYSDRVIRIELLGDEIESIKELAGVTLNKIRDLSKVTIFPARHFVVPQSRIQKVVSEIKNELNQRLPQLGELEAHRLKTRTKYDLEQIEHLGYCNGVENYSRYFDGRKPGEPPYSLMDFFKDDSLLVLDESHVTIPQLHGMHEGDRSRKQALVDFGFRLPSAFDNRPLKFSEFEQHIANRPTIFVSATPSLYEKSKSSQIVEQLVRPTGILDPQVTVLKSEGQIQDLMMRVKAKASIGQRTLVTTLTKRMAEDLTEFLAQNECKVRYLHSEIDTISRNHIIRELRVGKFDCLVGINLLREGLDIPEVGLVAILDADKEGFLRSSTSLVQTIGRAARNVEGEVVFYADQKTKSMLEAVSETDRRRAYQMAYNKKHGITPKTVFKKIKQVEGEDKVIEVRHLAQIDLLNAIAETEEEMRNAAENLDFEKAIFLRDKLKALQDRATEVGKKKK